MKPSRPRIFIVSKKAKPTQVLQTEAVAEGQQVRKQRGNSKRKSMFVQLVGREPQERRGRYEYNFKNHIHTESLGTVLSCDLLGKSDTENHTQNKQRDEEKESKGILHTQPHTKEELIPKKEEKVEQKIEGTIHEVNNQQTHENLNNRNFSSHRLKIFDQNFKPNAYLSSVSIKRQHLFFRHQSQQNRPLLNSSLSKYRRRIFSHDSSKPFLHLFQQNSPQKPLPLQATIKQQDEQSRITQPIRESLHRSSFPQL